MSNSNDLSTFQGLILALQQFWADKGCVVLQPLDLEVGAGTFHPATFLRAIGPESWNTAYVQPCRRPTDGRYGENPNRLQHYYQFQVILKPSPSDIQELYLESLQSLGIDMAIHDVRFHLCAGLRLFAEVRDLVELPGGLQFRFQWCLLVRL